MSTFFSVVTIPSEALATCYNLGRTRRYAVKADTASEARERVRSETNWKPHPGISVYPVNPTDPRIERVLDSEPQTD